RPPQPAAYGHALHCAKKFVGNATFLHLVSDHLYISQLPGQRCAQQLVAVAETEGSVVSAVQPTPDRMRTYYGTIGGRRVTGRGDLYEVKDVLEKPTPTEAEQTLMIPGLR